MHWFVMLRSLFKSVSPHGTRRFYAQREVSNVQKKMILRIYIFFLLTASCNEISTPALTTKTTSLCAAVGASNNSRIRSRLIASSHTLSVSYQGDQISLETLRNKIM